LQPTGWNQRAQAIGPTAGSGAPERAGEEVPEPRLLGPTETLELLRRMSHPLEHAPPRLFALSRQ
jgi:hypothetical protein